MGAPRLTSRALGHLEIASERRRRRRRALTPQLQVLELVRLLLVVVPLHGALLLVEHNVVEPVVAGTRHPIGLWVRQHELLLPAHVHVPLLGIVGDMLGKRTVLGAQLLACGEAHPVLGVGGVRRRHVAQGHGPAAGEKAAGRARRGAARHGVPLKVRRHAGVRRRQPADRELARHVWCVRAAGAAATPRGSVRGKLRAPDLHGDAVALVARDLAAREHGARAHVLQGSRGNWGGAGAGRLRALFLRVPRRVGVDVLAHAVCVRRYPCGVWVAHPGTPGARGELLQRDERVAGRALGQWLPGRGRGSVFECGCVQVWR